MTTWGTRITARARAGADGPARGGLRAAFVALWAAAAVAGTAQAQDGEPPRVTSVGTSSGEQRTTVAEMAAIVVLASEDEERFLPGAGTYVPTAQIRQQGYDDVNRVMRRVPGVVVRPEDGFGLFPNLSLRGVDPARAAKVTVMEDGVLAAPAPYAAPSAYYSPTTGRMHAIEVLKGSSQLRFGPHTTGGVVNYVSTPIPSEWRGYVRATVGGDGETRLFGNWGGWYDTKAFGRFGILLEGYRRESDGFKRIDRAPDFSSGDDTGFTKTEPMIKLAWEPDTDDWFHRVELKWGKSDLDANETYTGLSEEDFEDDPYRRYAASRFDNIETEQYRRYLRWYAEPCDEIDFTFTLYANSFERDWFKLHDVRDAGGSRISVSEALARRGSHLATLRGQAAGELRVRHNARTYYSKGWEGSGNFRFATGDVRHTVHGGVRLHEDRIRRFQRNEILTQGANGAITARNPGIPGDAGNRRQKTDSFAWWLQDTIEIDRLTLVPGVRSEHLRLDHTDFDDLSTEGRDRMTMDAFGIGGTYEVDESWTFFGGVHEGFSPPSPRARVKDELDEETSTGWELGVRYEDPDRALRATATLFRTDLDDLIVIDNVGGAGTGDSENVGEIRTQGLELSVRWDAGRAYDRGYQNPWFLTATFTDAELRSDASSTDSESVFAGGEKGADVPYVPEWSVSAGTGFEQGPWSLEVTGTYVDATYTTASNTSRQVAPDGTPNSRFGKTDSYFVVDVSGRYQASENVAIVGGIQNLLDREYLVSRHPHGPRPGKPLFGWFGVEIEF